MPNSAEKRPKHASRMRENSRSSASSEPKFAVADESVDASRYVVIPTDEGWQLLLELGPRYLRWQLRGAPGDEGQAWPEGDVAAASLEAEDGSLHKPQLARDGIEVGSYRNVRRRDGQVVPLGECLDEGAFELVFEGAVMGGRWRLSRSGSARRQAENWTLLRAMGNRLARRDLFH